MKLVLMVLTTTILFAQTKPDFTGTWKLNLGKSTLSGPGSVDEMTIRIRHREPEFVLTLVRPDGDEEFKLATDGKEYTNPSRGVPLTTVLSWQGAVLRSVSNAETPNGPLRLDDTMALSADGKVLKVVRRFLGSSGETRWDMHFDKRAAPEQDLTGNWIAIAAKSNFGSMPVPQKMSAVIYHHDPYLRIQTALVTDAGEQKWDVKYMTDGTEAASPVGTMNLKSKGRWQSGSLLIDSRADDIVIHDKWTLSKDGKTLTLVRDYTDPQTKTVQTIVHEKH